MVIRDYRSSDLGRCRALWAEMTLHHREIYGDPSIGGDDPELGFDDHLARVGPELIWVADSGSGVVGFVSLIYEGQEAEIEPIVVAAESRSTGIGHQLVKHAVEQARKLGVLCLSVKPVARNEDAIAFFHDAGFRTLGHLQLFMWLGQSFPGQWRSGPELFGREFDY
ncbi:MAG: GNAT family N-acetyltransferase [Gemmatimonadota bacterium]|nr:MAG: GNAT family N-acetyltransferase [Gemmatimonadota bacterium]